MKNLGPLSRNVALAGLLALSAFSAQPVQAAKADVDFLKSFVGEWRGRGALVGAESETVVCRLTLSQGNADKVNYSGRCAMAGTTLSVNGTLAYNDQSNRYEAAMTSNVAFSGLAVGRRQGNALVFNLRERETDESGNDMTITAAIALRAERITVDFQVLFNESGGMLKAQIPFSK